MLTEEARPTTADPADSDDSAVVASEPPKAPAGPAPPRELVSRLAERISLVGHGFPVKRDVAALTDELIGVLFPQLSSEPPLSARDAATRLLRARDELGRIAWPLLAPVAQYSTIGLPFGSSSFIRAGSAGSGMLIAPG